MSRNIVAMAAVGSAMLFGAVCAGASTTPAVSKITVSPSPFYSDISVMIVSFQTLRAAPAGHRYYVTWSSVAPRSTQPPGCATASNLDPVGFKGGTRERLHVLLQPWRPLGDAFCPGPSFVMVQLERSKANGKGYLSTANTQATLALRVQRP
jgi:hypothetical protein